MDENSKWGPRLPRPVGWDAGTVPFGYGLGIFNGFILKFIYWLYVGQGRIGPITIVCNQCSFTLQQTFQNSFKGKM